MKVSILGTNGFLSNAIGRYANEHGWQLDMYGLTKPDGISYDSFREINLIERDLDCSSMLGSDVIVYAIGAGIQSNLRESVDLIYSLNVTAPVSICNKLKILGYKGVFVTFGSYFELGEADLRQPASEQDVINANAPAPTDYVVSKRMLTRFVTSYKHDFTHWHFILPTIYGPGENPLRLIPYTINALRKEETPHFTDGYQIRQYAYVGDIPRVIALATIKQLSSGVYNIAGADTLSIREIVRIIYQIYGVEKDADFGNNAIARGDVTMSYLSLSAEKLQDKISSSFITLNIKDVIKMY